MRTLIFFFLLAVAPLNALDMPPTYELTPESKNLLKELKVKRKVDSVVSEIEKMYSSLSAQSDMEIEIFFQKAKVGCEGFAKEASSYYRDIPENRKAIADSFKNKIFSEDDLSVLQKNLNEAIKNKFKAKLEETFAEYDLFQEKEANLKKMEQTAVAVNPGSAYFSLNQMNLFLNGLEIGLDFIYGDKITNAATGIGAGVGGWVGGPPGAVIGSGIGRVAGFAISFFYFGSHSSETEIKNSLIVQLEEQKSSIKRAVNEMIRENLHRICELIREKLEEHFSKELGGQ